MVGVAPVIICFQPSFLALQVRLVLQRLREFGRVESRNVEAGDMP